MIKGYGRDATRGAIGAAARFHEGCGSLAFLGENGTGRIGRPPKGEPKPRKPITIRRFSWEKDQ